MPGACEAFLRAGAVVLALAGPIAVAITPTDSAAQATAEQDAKPIKDKHIGVSREGATKLPRSEGDQALVDGWPLYRNDRGQTAFNDAMATLKATDGPAPSPQVFKGCAGLECKLSLPALTSEGWMPPGRIWVSATEYVLIAHSPRRREGQSYRRRAARGMTYFVFHEFHNSSRNTDLFDTVASHKSSVFVPFYMGKQSTDSKGRHVVIVVQVAPHDVVSIHASNMGSAGPGIEIAMNAYEAIEPLQKLAGILVATIVKAAVPRLEVVNHHGTEGKSALEAYEGRLATLEARANAPTVELPFVPAPPRRVATATGRIEDLILRPGLSPRIPVAERVIVPPKAATAASRPEAPASEPKLIGPVRLATRPAPLPASGTGR